MGNKIARTTQSSATEYYLHDLPSSYNLVLKEVRGRERFLKSILCKHDEGLVFVKVYFKRGDSVDLRDYERRLASIRDIFSGLDHAHVWPFQFWLETDKAAYLLRQYFFNNLHDRMNTRPFLSLVEKKWLAFQLLLAAKQSHEGGVCHGDIKCENVLVTSWNWLYLADFASYKPTYIPYDDPSDFSFFFDTGGRRRCYVAPERFYEHGGEMQVAQDSPLKPSMDIFSVGCVIAELFLEGQPLFELSQLLAYRRGQYDPSQHLEKIPDSGIRKMVLHMIQLDPESRCSAESYLQSYAGAVFPSYFSPFLHKFYSFLNPLSSDARVLACETSFQEILRQMMGNKTSEVHEDLISEKESSSDNKSQLTLAAYSKQDSKKPDNSLSKGEEAKKRSKHDQFDLLVNVNTLLRDVEQNDRHFGVKSVANNVVKTYTQNHNQSLLQAPGELMQSISNIFQRNHHPFLKKIAMTDLSLLISDYNHQSDTFGMPLLPVPQDILSCEGMVLIASLLCSCIRNVKVPFIKRTAVLLLKSCSLYIDDEDRLQRILPYVIAVLSDPAAIVRCAALETLCDILPLVRDFPPSDAKIFPEYILPMLSMLPDDSEESVRICYASNISKLALTAYGFLIHSISLTEAGVLNETNLSRKLPSLTTDVSGEPQRVNNDAQLAQLRKSIAEVIQELVMGPKQTPNIRRALLHDIGNLCWFFGQRQSNDFLLPILPAFLNDHDEQLRAVFYGQIIYVCFFVGQRSVEEYLWPYIEQALNDITESVIVNALDCLAILCRSGFLRKRILLEMIERAFPLLCYPSNWVRRSAVTFVAASSENLGAVDSYVFLVPVVRPLLRRQPVSLASEKALLGCLKPPISRELYQQVLENARSSDMLERQRKIWYNTSSQSKQLDPAGLLQKTAGELDSKFWSDRQNESFTSISGEHMDSTNLHDDARKLKTTGSLTKNAFSQNDIHDHIASEKSQPPGFMLPQMSCMNSFIDKSSESIPLYYFKVDNKRTSGTAPAASDPSFPNNSLGFGTSSLPLTDPENKSFSLVSSIPAPKLVSGSVYVGNSPGLLRRVVHEVEDRETDESPYISSKFHEMRMSDRKGSSLAMDDHCMSAESTELSSLARPSSIPDSGWRPRGVLVAHLQEHRSAVRDISISMDQHFFVSASEDSTVKIWDCKRLEKDISFRSRLTYSLGGGQAMCVAVLRGSNQVVVGGSDGIMHIFSVDHISRGLGNVVENYSGIADVNKSNFGEGAILSLLNYFADGSTSKSILCSTQNCGIHLWDTRTSSSGWNTKVSPVEGYISSLVADPCGNWFVSGSSRGVLTLWDLRFCIPVNSWQYSLACPIEKMCLFVPPPGTPLSTATRPLVYVAAGCNEVSLWNAENGCCHQVLRAANHESDADNCESSWALARSSGKTNTKSDPRRSTNSKYRIDELNEPSPRVPGIRALLPLPGGDLLTGGTDLKIRRWDHCSPDRSYCVCGPSVKGVSNDDFYETKSSFGVQVVQETKRRPLAARVTGKAIIAAAATDTAGCHRDSILSLASVKLNQRLVISSSRDGAIKVWK